MRIRKYLALLSSITGICLLVAVCFPSSVLGATVFVSTPAPDLIIETTGAPGPSSDTFGLVKRGEKILVLGICEEPVEADFMRATINELMLVFSYLGYEEFPDAIELLSNGKIDVKPLISKIIPLEKTVEEGFKDLTSEDSSNIKILVKCN